MKAVMKTRFLHAINVPISVDPQDHASNVFITSLVETTHAPRFETIQILASIWASQCDFGSSGKSAHMHRPIRDYAACINNV